MLMLQQRLHTSLASMQNFLLPEKKVCGRGRSEQRCNVYAAHARAQYAAAQAYEAPKATSAAMLDSVSLAHSTIHSAHRPQRLCDSVSARRIQYVHTFAEVNNVSYRKKKKAKSTHRASHTSSPHTFAHTQCP